MFFMASKALSIAVGIIGGSMIGGGIGNAVGLPVLGAPVGAIVLTALLLERNR